MRALARRLRFVALLGALACTPAAAPPPAASSAARTVHIDAEPGEAGVYIDGELRGRTPATLKLEPGKYRLSLKGSRFLPYETDLLVPYGEDVHVTASLIASH